MAGSDITTRFLFANNCQNELKQGRREQKQLEKGEKVILNDINIVSFLKAKR